MKFQQQYTQKQKQVQSQKLVLTQQLQQSIQVLQFSSDELNQFVEDQTLENPLLELIDTDFVPQNSISSSAKQEETDYLAQIPSRSHSLFEYLLEQIHLNYRDTYLRSLVLFLVEYIDVNGFLSISLDEAVEITGGTPIQLLDALTLIQQLDPAGVGARDLQECLMLQTERDEHAPALAYIMLEEFFEELVQRKWEVIAKNYQVSLPEVQKIFDYLQHLTATPGAVFDDPKDLYIVPDLTVTTSEQGLVVSSNKNSVRKVTFQQNYFDQMKKNADAQVLAYLNEKQQEFIHLKKMIEQRGDTILRVGEYIVAHQQAFFLNPARPLKPLILKEVAEKLDIHESTVSRAVNGKYLATEFGVFELKSFFSHKLISADGEESSTASVKVALKEIVDLEDKQKPLSDQKIVDALKVKGMNLSRRTVAKYREQLGIPGSSKRKRYE
ncbi:RNA polymerase factor sigma-54 [Enterococcus lemanii]|uniref:RNA polymerase factor sigma-54 n=1 Tax=Enterococcus lemanii TaxID=1159752 RepID=A0ABV9MV28_9ENTE|nr:RNA polymerase factor sigma-54 [Enterococcus lemanii]MBM7708388.1 RNA polymerase sigma-54 factor [Enterococcus lemanii]